MASTFVSVDPSSHFTPYNIPFGIFSRKGSKEKQAASAIGNFVVDLKSAAENNLFRDCNFSSVAVSVFSKDTLNDFIALGKAAWTSARKKIQYFLSENSLLKNDAELREKILIPLETIDLHLPVAIGDYTDFYSSKEHATNVGIMFRGKDNALQPNWIHMPIGYHGRASSVFVSGTPIHRPYGQIKPKEGPPVVSVSKKLDFELEMAFVVGAPNEPGKRISIDRAEDHIFGVVLMNDWSARDIQAWEYVPLGPFLGKSFGTIISPWIITMEALSPFLTEGPLQDPVPLDYLRETQQKNYDVELEVSLVEEENHHKTLLCSSNLKYLYWSFRQQLAHHTINGCNMNVGDLCGTGTISGPTPNSYGSLLELTWNGEQKIVLASGQERTFIEDGDTVILTGKCSANGIVVGFGECICPVLPANNFK